LADEEAASEREQEETGDVLHHSVEEGESLLLPLLVEQLRSSLLLDKKCAGSASALAPPPHSLSSQSLPEVGQVERVEDSGIESGEDLRLLAVGLRDSIELHRQQEHDTSTQKLNSASGSTEPLGPSLLLEVQTALSRLQASLQRGVIGEGQEALDPAKRDVLLQLVSRLQASLHLSLPPDKGSPKTDSPEKLFHSTKQAQKFQNRTFRQNRHTLAVTKEELADARRLVEENAAKDRSVSNSSTSGNTETARELMQGNMSQDLALPEGSTVSSVVSPVERVFRPVHFTPRHSLPGPTFNGNTSAKPFFLSRLQKGVISKNSHLQAENRRSSCSDIDVNSDNSGVTDSNGIHRPLRQSASSGSTCNMSNNTAVPVKTDPEIMTDFPVVGSVKILPQCTVQKENGYNLARSAEPHSQPDKHDDMHAITAVHREYRPGKLGQEGVRPIQKSVSLDSSSSATQSVVSLAEQAVQKAPVYSSSTSSTASSKASTPLRSDSGNSVPEKNVHKPVSKASSLESSSSSVASAPQRSDSGTSVGERVANKHVPQASLPQRSNSGPTVADRFQRRSVSQGSAVSSTSSSKASTPRSDSGSCLPSRHIQKPQLSGSSSPHKSVAQSASLDSASDIAATLKGSAPDSRTISHSVSLDSDSRDYDPSVLLFTPAQSVQIAVHKAAINKQLSLEEEKRQKASAQFCQKTYESEDDDSDEEASSEDEGSSETDDEEEDEDNTCTVRQAPADENKQREISNNHNVKNVDDSHSQTDVNSAQIKALNAYNSKQKTAELESWQASVDDSRKTGKQDAVTSRNTWNKVEHWSPGIIEQNLNEQDMQNVAHTIQNPVQTICTVLNNIETGRDNNNTCMSISSAQRLLQMATEDGKEFGSRSHGRSDRKVKMKRANTIDIPKPLNFYEIEEETDYSSGEEYVGEGGARSGRGVTSDQHRAAYLALRGPVRVENGNKAFAGKISPPAFQPKTESDHKFLAFLQQHSNGKGSLWRDEAVGKASSYNPSARGGQHWSSRFTNIKTAFETSAERSGGEPGRGRRLVSSGPASARTFWQSADDSATLKKSATASGPKLTRQGSNFLKKLFEQKEQEQQSKLPWTERNAASTDSVVVGSLTVAASTGAVLSKKQLFTPPQSPAPLHAPLNINKFSHAPMSAFQPIEKKQKAETVNNSVDEGISQLTTGPKASKQRTGFTQQTKQELLSPVTQNLPWTRDGIQPEYSVLNSAVIKFENISRETSPQPVSLSMPQSRNQDKTTVVPGNTSVSVKQHAPVPTPRSYVPPSHTSGSLHGCYQEKTTQAISLNNPKAPQPIPTPPVLTAPHLIQNYGKSQEHFHEDVEIHSSYNQPKCGDGIRIEEQKTEEIPRYCTKSYTTEIDYGNQDFTELPSVSPVPQTYSGSVSSRCSMFPQSGAVFIPSSNVQQPEMDSVESPDTSLPSPEAFTAVSHIMVGPTSHQAVTVTQRTRHRYDDMEEEADGRSSAAKNLSSVLIKFSSAGESSRNMQGISKQSNSALPMAALGNKADEAAQKCKQGTGLLSSKKSQSPTIDRFRKDARESQQYHLLAKPSQKETRSPTSCFVKHHSEPDITSMISDEHFKTYQEKLQNKLAEDTNNWRSPPYQKNGKGSYETVGYSQYSHGPTRRLGQFSDTGSVPGLSQESGCLPTLSARVRPASTESLITATSTEELQESGESVLTTRLEIPVYSNSNKVQNLTEIFPKAPRSSSLHDVSDTGTECSVASTSPNPATSLSSLTLRKSGSWHQLVAGQQGIRNKRPQSLALPELTIPNRNIRRIPPTLPKTKSSHSLSFPKQFEATLSPESIENKQREVEAYLKASTKSKSQEPQVKVQEPRCSSVPRPSEMLVLDDNLENVDEAFENVFNAAVSGNRETVSKRNTTHKTKRPVRQAAVKEHFAPHLSRSASSQFVHKQQAWEDSSMVRTKLAQHLSSK
jgi:hypothetical protein